MTRHVEWDDWQRVRHRIRPIQTAVLTREEPLPTPDAPEQDDRPPVPRPLRSHRPRSDGEWQAIAEGVRALLGERVRSGEWVWTGPRRLTVVMRPSRDQRVPER